MGGERYAAGRVDCSDRSRSVQWRWKRKGQDRKVHGKRGMGPWWYLSGLSRVALVVGARIRLARTCRAAPEWEGEHLGTALSGPELGLNP